MNGSGIAGGMTWLIVLGWGVWALYQYLVGLP